MRAATPSLPRDGAERAPCGGRRASVAAASPRRATTAMSVVRYGARERRRPPAAGRALEARRRRGASRRSSEASRRGRGGNVDEPARRGVPSRRASARASSTSKPRARITSRPRTTPACSAGVPEREADDERRGGAGGVVGVVGVVSAHDDARQSTTPRARRARQPWRASRALPEDVDRRPVRRERVHQRRVARHHPDAAVRGRIGRHGPVLVHRDPAGEVARPRHPASRTAPTRTCAPCGRRGTTRSASTARARRDVEDALDAAVDDLRARPGGGGGSRRGSPGRRATASGRADRRRSDGHLVVEDAVARQARATSRRRAPRSTVSSPRPPVTPARRHEAEVDEQLLRRRGALGVAGLAQRLAHGAAEVVAGEEADRDAALDADAHAEHARGRRGASARAARRVRGATPRPDRWRSARRGRP